MSVKKIIALLAVILPLLASCADAEAPAVSVDPNKKAYGFEGGSLSAAVTTNGDWVAECDNEEISIVPSSGSGDAAVRIEIPASTKKETEAVIINFTTSKTVRDTLKTRKAKLVITREAMPFIDLSANEGYISPAGGGFLLNVTANHDWTATAPNPIAGLVVKPSESTFNSQVTVSLPGNETGAARSCDIIFSLKQHPDAKATVTVRQNPQ